MSERPFKIVEIGYLHILLAGYLVSVLCIKADLDYTTFALCNLLVPQVHTVLNSLTLS
jgi:hypothetical protein